MVLAANQTVAGRQVQVLVAVLGQPVPTDPSALDHHHRSSSHYRTAYADHRATRHGGGYRPPTTASPPPTTKPSSPTTTIPEDDLEVPDPFRYTRPVSPPCSMPPRQPWCR